MLHFAALLWNTMDPLQQRTVSLLQDHLRSHCPGLRQVFCEGGIYILCASNDLETEVTALPEKSGVVLGHIFDREKSDVQTSTHSRGSKHNLAAIVKTNGRSLIDSHWGSYVAILHDSSIRKSWILRSPGSSLHCLFTEVNEVRVLFSRMSDFSTCTLFRFDVNMKYVASFLLLSTQRDRQTGIEQIGKLAFGDCMEVDHRASTRIHQYWNPLDIARKRRIVDALEATTSVKSTVSSCVHAWASRHDSIVLQLSGGLDSSVILACLQSAPSRPRVSCVNLYSSRADSDERDLARLSARHLGFELIEVQRNPAAVNIEDGLAFPTTESPDLYIAKLGELASQLPLVEQANASAIFTGTYGDNLFFNYQYPLTVADYIHDFGFRSHLWSVAASAARLRRLTIWEVLRQGLNQGVRRHRWSVIHSTLQKSAMINKAVLLELMESTPNIYPWYDESKYVPPGKQCQIHAVTEPRACGISVALSEHNRLPILTPFLSQPIMELCLQIPTYVLSHNGWDREIERCAFAELLPSAITRRRTKGGHADYSAEIKKRNISFIRDLLMNGRLVSSGLLIKSELERALAGRSSSLDEGATKMSNVVHIELWLQIWANNRTQVHQPSFYKQAAIV